jgi:hypothetical protein
MNRFIAHSKDWMKETLGKPPRIAARFHRISFLAFLGVLVGIGHSPSLYAASLGVTPLTVEADAKAGDGYTSTLRVELSEPKDPAHPSEKASLPSAGAKEHVKMFVADWDMTPEGTLVYAKPGSIPGSCAKWITLNPMEFDIEAGQRVNVRYTVEFPKDVPNGTYRAVLFTRTQPSPLQGQAGVSVASAIGTILYLTVGPHERKAKVSRFTATPTGMDVTFQNLGSDHLRVNGTLKIESEDGNPLGEFPFPMAVVLPGSDGAPRSRLVHMEFPKEVPLLPGRYVLTAMFDFHGEELLGARTRLTVPESVPSPDGSTAHPS